MVAGVVQFRNNRLDANECSRVGSFKWRYWRSTCSLLEKGKGEEILVEIQCFEECHNLVSMTNDDVSTTCSCTRCKKRLDTLVFSVCYHLVKTSLMTVKTM